MGNTPHYLSTYYFPKGVTQLILLVPLWKLTHISNAIFKADSVYKYNIAYSTYK